MKEDDRRRILRLVADGTVTAEEGADLLDALQEEWRVPEVDTSGLLREETYQPLTALATSAPSGTAARCLIIRVEEGDKSKVNLRIPLGLARAARKFIPRRAQHDLGKHGIDLAALVEGLADGVKGGPLLQVEDGEDKVYIGVE